jgi:hypothetical protein
MISVVTWWVNRFYMRSDGTVNRGSNHFRARFDRNHFLRTITRLSALDTSLGNPC